MIIGNKLEIYLILVQIFGNKNRHFFCAFTALSAEICCSLLLTQHRNFSILFTYIREISSLRGSGEGTNIGILGQFLGLKLGLQGEGGV